jgi:hypothetical protein
MSDLLSLARELYAFLGREPYVMAACVAGLGGLLLGLGSGRREQ